MVRFSHMIYIDNAGQIVHYLFDVTSFSSIWVTSTTIVTPGTWYHVAITAKDGGMAKLYINGSEEGTAQAIVNMDTNCDRWNIGQSSQVAKSNFDGQMDELRIWYKELSQSEIQNHMFQPLNGNETGLEGYWRFEKGSGTTAYNATSNAYDGTLTYMDGGTDWIESEAWKYREIIGGTSLTFSAGYEPDNDPITLSQTVPPQMAHLLLTM